MAEGIFINAFVGQRIIGVRQTHHLGADGDRIPLQAFRIAVSIPAFVVIVTDVVGIAQIFFIPHAVQFFQDLAPRQGMGLHQFPFFGSQRPRFIQNGIRNGDLADVVERGRACHDGDGLLIQAVFRTADQDLFHKNAGEMTDAQDVLARFHTAVFDQGRQGIHHHIVGMAQDVRLFFYGLFQVPLVAIQFHEVVHAAI